MCSRFEINAKPHDLVRRFGFDELPDSFALGEIRPTNRVLTLTAAGPAVMSWGLKVDWDTKPLINARAETLTEKKTFQPLLDNRCLVPATAYFEWRHNGKARLKNRIAPTEGGLFGFAALNDGANVTIITCVPQPGIAHIQNRMPVVLPAAAETAWLDPTAAFADVAPLLRPDAAPPLDATEDVPPPPAQGDLFG